MRSEVGKACCDEGLAGGHATEHDEHLNGVERQGITIWGELVLPVSAPAATVKIFCTVEVFAWHSRQKRWEQARA